MTSAAYELQPRDHAPAGPDPTPADHALVLQEPIGTGGAAVVYRAYDSRLDRLVAVKLLPAAAALDARSRERFLAEIRITAAFDHPHIVSVFGAGTKDDAPYLEMQAITGRSLDQVIADMQALVRNGQQLTGETMLQLAQRREPTCAEATTTSESLPRVRATPCYYRQVARWVADVASALEHVHARGFVHGDVKPANLLIEPSGHLWLIDFGAASELHAGATATEHVAAGTLPYLAPERLEGAIAPDVRQDVYGLGATLYELLTLRRPFAGQSAQALMRELATKRPIPLRKLAPTTPRALEAIATCALARRPLDRFATMTDVEQALVEYVRTEEQGATRPQTRRHLRWSTIVAVTLLTIFLAIFFLMPTRTPSLAQRAAHLAEDLPPGLRAELPGEKSPRLTISGVLQLSREPFELPLDLTTRDKLTWRIEPRPWLSHAGHSYTVTPHPSGWLAAEALAQAWGGHLVAINDPAEQEFLNRTFFAPDGRGQYPNFWIGLFAPDIHSEYRWSSEEPVTFRNWNSGEPSRGWGVERFVVVNWQLANNVEPDGRLGDWNDVPETGLRKTGGYQGIVELPQPQQSMPPVLSVRRADGSHTKLSPTGNRLPGPGRLTIAPAVDSRQLVEVTITVE